MVTDYSFITAHRDLADHVFAGSILDHLVALREGLLRHGYTLAKVDIGKRSTRVRVTSRTLRAASTYRSVEDFIISEEIRLASMDKAATS